MTRRFVIVVVAIVLVVGACGEVEQGSSTIVDAGTESAADAGIDGWTGHPKRPEPGSPSGRVSVENPCDTAIEIRWRLAPRGEDGVPPDVIATVQPGRAASPTGYQYPAGSGARDVVVFAPELGWSAREPAREDGDIMHFTIDAEVCPPAE